MVLTRFFLSGTEKLPILVIGKFSENQNFRKVKSLPAKYQSEANAWMTTKVFEDYLLVLDKKFEMENRNVLVVIETNSAHSTTLVSKLTNIHLIFQQPNSLSPLRYGIVKNVKHFYRKEIVGKEVNAFDVIGSSERMDVLEAMTLLAESWEKVTEEVIVSSFIKAGWVQDSDEVSDFEDVEIEMGAFFQASLRMLNLDINSYLNYLTLDDLVATTKVLTDDDICRVVIEDEKQIPDFRHCVVVEATQNGPKQSEEPTVKSKITTLSLSKKLEIIERKNAGELKSDLCKEYGICLSVFHKVIQTQNELVKRFQKNPNLSDFKKFRQCKFVLLEESLVIWMRAEEIEGENIRPKVRVKALELATQFGYNDFRASDGWWERFKKRNGIETQMSEKKVAEKAFDVKLEDPFEML